MNDLSELVDRLRAAGGFQNGAEQLLEHILGLVEGSLQKPEFAGVQVLRGIIHHRSDVSYQNLAIVERVLSDTANQVLQPSATAWKLINEAELPVVIDTLLGEASYLASNPVRSKKALDTQIDPTKSIRAMGMRETTQVLALPLPGTRSKHEGMVSLEFLSNAIGAEYPWLDMIAELEVALMVGAPHVLALPSPSQLMPDDSALPVSSAWFAERYALLRAFASQKQTLLICGPTGCGKTYLANWIHRNSPQAHGPFVEAPLNEMTEDGGLPHLFGWAKGAFTSAVTKNDGWACQAEGGTLFLDEIDTLTKEQQQGLLGFLDTGRFHVMGTDRTRQLQSVRFIVATNANLVDLVAKGLFREDLYHRINTLVVDIPSIDDRRDEIPAWAGHFARAYVTSNDELKSINFTPEGLSLLSNQSYPGNLRRLNSIVVLAYIHASSQAPISDQVTIDATHIEAATNSESSAPREDAVSLLYRTAQALYETALRSGSERIDQGVLKHKGLLLDMVWLVAIQELGDSLLGDRRARDKVALLLDKEAALRSNNYGAELKRCCHRLAEFYGRQGRDAPLEVRKILGNEDG